MTKLGKILLPHPVKSDAEYPATLFQRFNGVLRIHAVPVNYARDFKPIHPDITDPLKFVSEGVGCAS